MSDTDPFVALAVITSSHGTKGEFKVKPFTASPDSLFTYCLHDKNGKLYALSRKGEVKGQVICRMDGVRFRDEADNLKGIELGVNRSVLPEPDADEFYLEDLEGVAVILEDGSTYGTVRAVHNFGAGDILDITKASGGDEMLCFDEKTVLDIDLIKGEILVQLPDVVKGEPSS